MSHVRHIVLWNKVDSLSDSDFAQQAAVIKRDLEALTACVDGIVEIAVSIDPLPSSNADLLLDSTFVNAQALESYQKHPEHLRVGALIQAVTQNRRCFDYTLP